MHKLLLAGTLLASTLMVQAATRHHVRIRHHQHRRHRSRHNTSPRRILLAPHQGLVIEKSPSHTKAAAQLKAALKVQGAATPKPSRQRAHGTH